MIPTILVILQLICCLCVSKILKECKLVEEAIMIRNASFGVLILFVSMVFVLTK